MVDESLWSEQDRIQWREQWRTRAITEENPARFQRGSRIHGKPNSLQGKQGCMNATLHHPQLEEINTGVSIECGYVRYDDEIFSRYVYLYLYEPGSDIPRCDSPLPNDSEHRCCLPVPHPGPHA